MVVRILLLIAFFLLTASPTNAHAGTHVIKMTSNGFDPKIISIEQGETVEFENISDEPRWPASNIHPTHEIYPEFDPQKTIAPGDSWSFTFTKPGVYKMHDHVHPQDVGSITVTANTTSTEVSPTQFPTPTIQITNKVIDWKSDFIKRFFTIIIEKGYKLVPIQKPAVAENNPAIFNSEALLKQYVAEYGPAKTILKLFEYSSQFGDCHQIAHKAGRFSYEIYGSRAFQECSAECHSGCYHGATEAYFKVNGVQNIEKNLSIICSSDLNPFLSHQCIHGVGHGLMAWANYDIHEALKYCDTISNSKESCYTGVFMENIVGGLAEEASEEDRINREGHFTKFLSEDPRMPCNVVDEKYRMSCYFYQTSRMVTVFKGDFQKIANECGSIESIYSDSCFASMGRDVGGNSPNDPQRAIQLCGYAPEGRYRDVCLSGAVQNTFWDTTGQSEALSFCSLLTKPSELQICYDTVVGRAKDVVSASDMSNFCAKIPQQYRALCN